MYLCQVELIEIELLICIKMDLALNNLQSLYVIKPKQTNILLINQFESINLNWSAKKLRESSTLNGFTQPHL